MADLKQPHHKGSKGKHPPLSSRKHPLPKAGRGSIKRAGKGAVAGAKKSHHQAVGAGKKAHKAYKKLPAKQKRVIKGAAGTLLGLGVVRAGAGTATGTGKAFNATIKTR